LQCGLYDRVTSTGSIIPVTARLSRRFYEKFGDEIVNELVEWLNQVDAAYRSEVKEAIDISFVRFDAKLDQRLAELKAELIKWMFLFWAGTALAGLLIR
jgi:hypothetical protein